MQWLIIWNPIRNIFLDLKLANNLKFVKISFFSSSMDKIGKVHIFRTKYIIRSIVDEASCHLVSRSVGQSVTQSLGYLVTCSRSFGHLVIWSLGNSIQQFFNIATSELMNNIRISRSALQTKIMCWKYCYKIRYFHYPMQDRAAKFVDMLSAIGGTMGLLVGSFLSALQKSSTSSSGLWRRQLVNWENK